MRRGGIPPAKVDSPCAAQQVRAVLAAWDLQFSPGGTRSEVSADLAPCYPEVSGLRLACRTVILEREATPRVEIRDDIEAEHPVPVRLNWLTACEPAEISADGWTRKRGDRTFFAHLEGATEIHCENIKLDDPQLREGWGPQLWRLVATAPASTHTHLRLGTSGTLNQPEYTPPKEGGFPESRVCCGGRRVPC